MIFILFIDGQFPHLIKVVQQLHKFLKLSLKKKKRKLNKVWSDKGKDFKRKTCLEFLKKLNTILFNQFGFKRRFC